MDKNWKKTRRLTRLYVSLGLTTALLAVVSLVSFADAGHRMSEFGVKAKGVKGRLQATASDSIELEIPTPEYYHNQFNLKELLEQEADNDDAIIPTWFQVSLNGIPIVDSDNWSVTLKENKKIKPNAALKHQLKVTIYPQYYNLGEGDSVTWNLGQIEGLSLDSELWEELILSGGIHAGNVMLCYTDNSDVILYTEFTEAVNRYSSISITYWYDCGFISVSEPTDIIFNLPGYEEPVLAVLLPGDEDPATEEEATAEESSPQETPEDETVAEESSPQETTEEETAAEESSPQEATEEETATEEPPQETQNSTKVYGSGRGSGSDRETTALVKETTIVPEMSPENSTEIEIAIATETAVDPHVEESQSMGQNVKNMQPAEDPEESDDILDINISFGAEVSASHEMQFLVLPEEILTYKISISNHSEEPIKNVRIRDYLPERTSFVLAENDGVYGIADGQQYITWRLESILPGEERQLIFQVKVFRCTPPYFSVKSQVYWQADDSRSTHSLERPSNQIDFPMVTIG